MSSPSLPPAQPTYVLRGHNAHVHSVEFLRRNTRLLTGDADGWIVLWRLTTKRAVAVWKAHEGAILAAKPWGDSKIVTHGRDNALRVWQLRDIDEDGLSKDLPIDETQVERRQPWLLHSLKVNSLNFCSFSMCAALDHFTHSEGSSTSQSDPTDQEALLMAAPGSRDAQVNIYQLPTEELVSIIPPLQETKTSLLMALHLSSGSSSSSSRGPLLRLAAGYESGLTAVHQHSCPNKWATIYSFAAHTQPILSLDAVDSHEAYFTSSADDILARHPWLPSAPPQHNASSGDDQKPTKQVRTRHSGQQSLRVRSDGRIFATAGWDGRARVYSAKSMKELAVLKWHHEGCYAVAFAEILRDESFGAAPPSRTSDPDASATQIVEDNPLDEDGRDRSDRHTSRELLSLRGSESLNVQEKREVKTQTTHWLAVGAKDGKVSLWDIY